MRPLPVRLSCAALAGVFVLAACGGDDPATSPTTSDAPSQTASPDATAPGSTPDGPIGSTPAEVPADAAQAEIINFLYEPETIEVAVGTTINWTNQDRFGHTVTAGRKGSADPDSFDLILGKTTDADTTGLQAAFTFEVAGTFEYFCRYHPSMEGTVVVS